MKSILRIPLLFNDYEKSKRLNEKIKELNVEYIVIDIQYLINESEMICIITHTLTKFV